MPPRRPWPGRHPTWTAILSAVGLLVILGIVGSVGGSKTGSHPSASSSPTPTPTAAATHAAKKQTPPVYTSAQRQFFRDVDKYVPALGAGDSALVSIGNSICNLRHTGISQRETIAEQTFPNLTSISQQARLVRLAEKDLCRRYLPLPATPKVIARPAPSTPAATTPAVAVSLCGAPPNPYKLNLCGRGSLVYSPPADVCSYFNCIPNFPNGTGYMVECNDGMYSMSGGRPGACSYHDGEGTAVTQG